VLGIAERNSRLLSHRRRHIDLGADLTIGGEAVEAVRLRDRETGSEEVVACRGLFVFVGLVPNAGMLGQEVARGPAGFVVTDAHFETALPGVFAVGAIRSGYGGRLTHAVAEATTAAELAAARCEA